jgi:hypothetical protein
MAGRAEARDLVRRLAALAPAGTEVVRRAAARELLGRHPVDAVELLHALQVLSRGGTPESSAALAAVMAALRTEMAARPLAAELQRLAGVLCLDDVAALFVEAPPTHALDDRAAARADARLLSEPLGRLKQQARLTRDPDELARLAMASDPSVIRNILINPRTTEPLVVRIAARRPARPEPLVEIWRSPRWSPRHAVRRALVFNPYLPPELGAKILPLLTDADLAELARSGSVHPALREQAALLLRERPGH